MLSKIRITFFILLHNREITTMEDKGVQEKWGNNIYRINFAVTALKGNDAIQLMIAPQNLIAIYFHRIRAKLKHIIQVKGTGFTC